MEIILNVFITLFYVIFSSQQHGLLKELHLLVADKRTDLFIDVKERLKIICSI